VSIHPIGAITKKLEGKDLAEMYDMKNSGAVAFSDGLVPVQTAGLFLKALQYVKAFDGVLIQIPIDKSIGAGGLINEGIISTQLGLPGIPAISEETIIKRDIDLARYTGSKLHITGVSTKTSIDLIAQAKQEGLQISCSVTPYHLYFADEDLVSYDTNLKLNPPLRTVSDRAALREAVENGLVDCIATHHLPQNWDNKICEFEYAKSGMIGLQTAFAVVNTVLPNLSNEKIIALFSGNARNIFDLPTTHVSVGSKAELTLFSRTAETLLTAGNNQSKSANSPFLEKTLTGKAVGIVHKGKLFKQ
jgi:dihydroorotase